MTPNAVLIVPLFFFRSPSSGENSFPFFLRRLESGEKRNRLFFPTLNLFGEISLHSLTQEEQEGLEKEINVMKSLDHENILKYHAHWTTPNFLCFITDYQTHSLKK